MIALPDHMKCRENTVDSLIDTIYPGIGGGNLAAEYFSEHTILSSLNVDVDSFEQVSAGKVPWGFKGVSEGRLHSHL
jgi:hypothetical protein